MYRGIDPNVKFLQKKLFQIKVRIDVVYYLCICGPGNVPLFLFDDIIRRENWTGDSEISLC